MSLNSYSLHHNILIDQCDNVIALIICENASEQVFCCVRIVHCIVEQFQCERLADTFPFSHQRRTQYGFITIEYTQNLATQPGNG